MKDLRCHVRCLLYAATPPTCSPRTVTGAVSFKKSPNTRLRPKVFVNDECAMADWPCATHAIATQHGSCTDSCRLLFERDFNNQLIVFWNVGVGRLEKNQTNSTLPTKQQQQPEQLQTYQTSARQGWRKREEEGARRRCKSGCILGRAPGIRTNCLECCVDFFGPNSHILPTQIATTFFTLPGGCRLIIFSQPR